MRAKLKKLILTLRLYFLAIKGEWEDDLIWCPSQCEYMFTYKGVRYSIYLRWRWDDPWTAELIENADPLNTDKEVWHTLDVDFFRDNQLEELKKQAMKLAMFKLLEITQ